MAEPPDVKGFLLWINSIQQSFVSLVLHPQAYCFLAVGPAVYYSESDVTPRSAVPASASDRNHRAPTLGCSKKGPWIGECKKTLPEPKS